MFFLIGQITIKTYYFFLWVLYQFAIMSAFEDRIEAFFTNDMWRMGKLLINQISVGKTFIFFCRQIDTFFFWSFHLAIPESARPMVEAREDTILPTFVREDYLKDIYNLELRDTDVLIAAWPKSGNLTLGKFFTWSFGCSSCLIVNVVRENNCRICGLQNIHPTIELPEIYSCTWKRTLRCHRSTAIRQE